MQTISCTALLQKKQHFLYAFEKNRIFCYHIAQD